MVVRNTLIACGAHVLRFNGQSWLENSGLYPSNPDSGSEQRYAYGPDSAARHIAEAERRALTVRIVRDPALAFDIDVADDLATLDALDAPRPTPTS